MRNLLRWFKSSFWYWLVVRPRIAWITGLVLLVAVIYSFELVPSENSIRYAGLALQISGIVTVMWGIRETRKLFGLPSMFKDVNQWIRDFPRLKGKTISASAGVFTMA